MSNELENDDECIAKFLSGVERESSVVRIALDLMATQQKRNKKDFATQNSFTLLFSIRDVSNPGIGTLSGRINFSSHLSKLYETIRRT